MLYNTGLLVGRAYALAHDPERTVTGAVTELLNLAGGDRPALLLAEARLREFLARPTSSVEELRALHFLSAALERMDSTTGPGEQRRSPLLV